MKKLKGTVSHRERDIEDLRADPKLARAYLLGAAAVPLARMWWPVRVEAATLPHLAENDPTAKALNYRHDAKAAPRVDKQGVAAKDQI